MIVLDMWAGRGVNITASPADEKRHECDHVYENLDGHKVELNESILKSL